MAFPAKITQLSEAPDWAHEYYDPGDGGYVLKVQTVPVGEDLAGLKTALASERKLKRDTEVLLSQLKTAYGEMTPEQVVDLKKQLEALGDKKIYDEHGLEALITARVQKVQEAAKEQREALQRQLATIQGQYEQMTARWKGDRIDTALINTAAQLGVRQEAYQDVTRYGRTFFTDLDERGNPIARDGQGEILRGDDGLAPVSPREWLEKQKAHAPHYWPTSSGGGSPGGVGSAANGAISITATQARNNRVYEEARARAEKAGTTLVITDG
jgi:hypothetical protein